MSIQTIPPQDDVLIIGSGMSFHNMRGYGDPSFTVPFADFRTSLIEAFNSASSFATKASKADPPRALVNGAHSNSIRMIDTASAMGRLI